MTNRQPVKGAAAFSKTIAVLQLIADSELPPTSAELVKKTGMPRPTMRRILKALIAEDLVEQGSKKTFTLGVRPIELARKALDQNSLLQAVYSDLVWLSQKSNATAYLGIPVGNEFIFLTGAINESPVGSYGLYSACAIARSYLAQLPEDRQNQIIGSIDYPALTKYTITNGEDLRSELEQERMNGYSVGDQQLKLQEKCFGVCVRDASQVPCAGIGFIKPHSQLDLAQESKFVALLLQCRDRIKQNLNQIGYKRPEKST